MSETIRIETPEGDEIWGKMHTPDEKKGGTILLNHGFTSGKKEYKDEAKYLKRKGYEAFRWDRRGYGDSTGDKDEDIEYLTLSSGTKDLENVVNYLKDRWSIEEGLAAYGSSFGGKITLHYSAEHPEAFDVLALRAAGSYFDLIREEIYDLLRNKKGYTEDDVEMFMEDLRSYDAEKAVKKIQNPTIMFHGDDDEKVPIENSLRLLRNLDITRSLNIFKGWGHDFDEDEEMLGRTLNLTKAWFDNHL